MLYFENKALSTGKYQCRSVGNGHNQNGKVRNYKDNLQATNKNLEGINKIYLRRPSKMIDKLVLS